MDKIKLILPNKNLELALIEYKNEHFDNEEYELHGSSLFDKTDSYDDWLEQLKNNSNERTVRTDWVISTTFLAIRELDSKIVGMVDIRHTLNEFLRTYGGNIGYGVRPSERNKGYATQILKTALKFCKQLPLEKVMLTCFKNNEGSRKTILHNRGILEKEVVHTTGNTLQIFWIEL